MRQYYFQRGLERGRYDVYETSESGASSYLLDSGLTKRQAVALVDRLNAKAATEATVRRRRRRRAKENPGLFALIGILAVGAGGYLAYRLIKKPAVALPAKPQNGG